MRKMLKIIFSILFIRINKSLCSKPNIVYIMADDLGWNDVGFHGANEIQTPNIDALAYNGVILNSHYSESLCTPSRGALLTGKYPIRTGTQHSVILEASPWGLPLNETLMPQYFKRLGYTSHIFGKWHLGFYKKEYTPTFRGFKSHIGPWNGYNDYYSHIVQASFIPFEGYDMRRNLKLDFESTGKYTTHILTEEAERIIQYHNVTESPLFLYMSYTAVHAGSWEHPLQAPEESIKLFSYIKNNDKRIYAAMLWELDQSVGKLVKALKNKGILDNTIVIFISDNGAATRGLHKNTGSNWPLKGEKATPWEGGLRTPAVIWNKNLCKNSGEVLNGLVHITDWLPTLFAAAGGDMTDLNDIDGLNQWGYLKGEEKSPRHEMLHNIDDTYGYSAMRVGPFKYVNGTSLFGYLDDWVGLPDTIDMNYNIKLVINSTVNHNLNNLTNEMKLLNIREKAKVKCFAENSNKKQIRCNPIKKPCLFNIENDPCEKINLHDQYKMKIEEIERKISHFRKYMIKPGNKLTESRANPIFYNNTWTNWGDEIKLV